MSLKQINGKSGSAGNELQASTTSDIANMKFVICPLEIIF
jgi:hypothetical protein